MNPATENDRPIIVIGAGMAGLTAARRLHDAGRAVLVLDKGRGVGGRMATRRIDGVRFDHGAQFFTVRDDRFRRRVQAWQADGLVSQWSSGFPDEDGNMPADRHPRYRANRGMTAIPKSLAEGLEIVLQAKVQEVGQDGGIWSVMLDSGEVYKGRALILTPPVPQSLALLNKGGVQLDEQVQRRLAALIYDPCLSLMALFDGPSKIPAPGGIYFRQNLLAWIADNRQKGISDEGYGVTLHAGPDYSRRNWQTAAQDVAREMLAAAEPYLHDHLLGWQLQRWRYSMPQNPYPQPLITVRGKAPLIFAGDVFGGPRIEGAFLSGWTAADALLN